MIERGWRTISNILGISMRLKNRRKRWRERSPSITIALPINSTASNSTKFITPSNRKVTKSGETLILPTIALKITQISKEKSKGVEITTSPLKTGQNITQFNYWSWIPMMSVKASGKESKVLSKKWHPKVMRTNKLKRLISLGKLAKIRVKKNIIWKHELTRTTSNNCKPNNAIMGKNK